MRARGFRRAALAAAALGVGAAVFWIEFRYEVFPKRLVEVEPGRLYRSGQLSRRLIRDVLTENGIRVVVDLNADRPGASPDADAEIRVVEELGIEYHLEPLRGDGTGDVRRYAAAIATIERARRADKPTLVHCAAGARRAGGVVAAYQVLVRGVPAERAFVELDRYGRTPVAETPLPEWLNANMGELAGLLVEGGVLERVPDPLPHFEP